MLAQFLAKNILSFKDEVILDLTAIPAYKEHECNAVLLGKEKFLKVAAIYGANASGKSNLYFSMKFFQNIIRESLNNVGEDADSAIKKYYVPFKFEEGPYENTEFQIVEVTHEFEYRYGFEYNDKCIEAEWLYRKSLKTNRTVTVFERMRDEVVFGAAVRKECDIYKKQIPPETLVLSFFNKLKLKTNVFGEVYCEVMKTMVDPVDFYDNTKRLEMLLPRILDGEKETLLKFLTAIDSGIVDIEYDDSEKNIQFNTYHLGENKKRYVLNLYNESEGTIRSIMLFIYARVAILNNLSMFVDELNIKLHPLLVKFIVDLFYEEGSEAQLIYTTHDTTLMDKKFFRRDQIWFVQKDEYGHSELMALSDFKVRSDSSFEKDYLAGVYGGIPYLKDFELKEGE